MDTCVDPRDQSTFFGFRRATKIGVEGSFNDPAMDPPWRTAGRGGFNVVAIYRSQLDALSKQDALRNGRVEKGHMLLLYATYMTIVSL